MKQARFVAVVLGSLAGSTFLISGSNPAFADNFDWTEYMHSSFSIGAIAAAMSRVEHCSKKPLLIEELKDDPEVRILVITCDGSEEEEGSSIIHFRDLGTGNWQPVEFSFAG